MTNLHNYTQHSGGAIGSDVTWSDVGRSYGLTDCRHYWHGVRTPHGNTSITEEQMAEGWQHVLMANKTLHRKPEAYKSLLSRNWVQVKHSAAVYAIGTLKGAVVDGGTGWAVQMAIDDYKDVYVFDQVRNRWYAYDWDKGFTQCYAPTLTPHFAGIGTREINANGVTAIRAAYLRTINVLNGILKQ